MHIQMAVIMKTRIHVYFCVHVPHQKCYCMQSVQGHFALFSIGLHLFMQVIQNKQLFAFALQGDQDPTPWYVDTTIESLKHSQYSH